MPTFSASSVPSVVGLYVDKFVDRAGQLSNIVVTNQGSGYSSANPPQVVVSGGGGSGAVIEPVIIGDKLVGLKFVKDPNLGRLRGSNYTSIPSFSFIGGVGAGAAATCDLSQNTTILGVPVNENSLLQFCYDHGVNYLALYDMRSVNWLSETSTNTSSPGKTVLANFIAKARTSGITEIGAVTSGSASNVSNIISYNNTRTQQIYRFDWMNLELEYWNGDSTFADWLSRLTYMKQQATGATAYPLSIEVYLGWPDYAESFDMLPHIDRLLLHDYSSTKVPDYKYTQGRLQDEIGLACAALNKTLDLMPIFSAERVYSPWNASYEFMGLYYQTNTIYDAWYKWGVIPTGHVYNGTNLRSYNYESDPNVLNYVNPVGHIIFTQNLLRSSNPPTLPNFNSFITSNGPLTGITSGNTLQLTANPVGYSYSWYPGGQTTRTISVTQSGNYYVTVTNDSGKTSTSSAVTVSFSTGSTCVPTISYTGSSTFYSGNSIVLSASSGSTYYWTPGGQTTQNINVTNSGNYSVTVDTGTGCTGSSQFVTVVVEPCETTIAVIGTSLTDIDNNYSNSVSFSAQTGTSVTLSAMTTGTSIVWSTTETTQSILANTSTTYSVSVTNGGCVANASVDANFYNCIALISYTGSTTINSGETITLCSNYADSYLWYPNSEVTQCITVSDAGSYYVENTYISGCTVTSAPITINVLTGNCIATIDASGPLYYSSGISISSITLSASSGVTYLWTPNGETTQNIDVTESGIYTVTVTNALGCIAQSSIVVTANNWVPGDGFWTEDNFPARLNNNLSYTPAQIDYPWIEYKINLTNTQTRKYYSFFKFRSKNGKKTGLRFSVNNVANFIPITGIKDTTMGWYRIEINNFGLTQLLSSQVNNFYIQLNNLNCELEQFAISENPNFIPGPYPNYAYV
jgi:hypothetical protein